MSMKIIQTRDYKSQLIALYMDAFAKGVSEQYIDEVVLESYIDKLLNEGVALVAIENNEVLGALLSCPLAFDEYVTSAITENFAVEKCVYVAEMMVAAESRGKGIGKQLLTAFFETPDIKQYSDAFIRVWDKNVGAIALYEKMGFVRYTNIEQTKQKADGSGTFVMQKIYLHKKLI
jgi:GNAT superfamily N-acetyltransferase